MFDQATRLRELVPLMRDRVSETAASIPVSKAHIIAITSGKGGVGKSNIALNLALALCTMEKKTLLFDGNMNMANLDVLMGISPRYRLGHLLKGERKLADVLVTGHQGLRLLPADSGLSRAVRLDVPGQKQLVGELASLEGFDFLIIDTPAGLTPEAITFALSANETIIVTTPEPTAVMDTYAMIKIISQQNADQKIKVLVNAVSSADEAEETVQKLNLATKHFLHIEAESIGYVPFDPNVRRAVSAQEPFLIAFPSTLASEAVLTIAKQILQ